jgi:hypothetical protein
LKLSFDKNLKQKEYFDLAMGALEGSNDYRHLFYGGAIRGGKSYVSLAILAMAACRYAGSRWHVFRRDMPALLTTTIPSMEKILAGLPDWRWSRHPAHYYAENTTTGSRIFFKGENLSHDPALNDLLGLETNGILYEQIEELSEGLWQMGASRLGSWYTEPMPRPVTLATFNPSQSWIRERIYEPHRRGELAAPYYYMAALPADNGYVTPDQWQAWARLDERYRLQYIEGDWTDYSARDRLWAFAYDRARHLATTEIEADPQHMLHLSFDFNRNPICCSVIQCADEQIRVIETIKLANSDIYALCTHIRARYPGYMYMITGDSSGMNSSALVQNSLNYYTVIRQELGLGAGQLQVPVSNPRLADNQVLVNAILARGDVRINAVKAGALIYDLNNVKMMADGQILKANRNDPSQQADALDTFRYYCNVYHSAALGARCIM